MSPDAVIDEARGLVFPARIAITGSSLRTAALGDGPGLAGGEPASADDPVLPDRLVTPGMSAAVEIKTGKRSVLSFLLSPIARSVSEAGRER